MFAVVHRSILLHLETFDPEGEGSMLLRSVTDSPSNSMSLPC